MLALGSELHSAVRQGWGALTLVDPLLAAIPVLLRRQLLSLRVFLGSLVPPGSLAVAGLVLGGGPLGALLGLLGLLLGLLPGRRVLNCNHCFGKW